MCVSATVRDFLLSSSASGLVPPHGSRSAADADAVRRVLSGSFSTNSPHQLSLHGAHYNGSPPARSAMAKPVGQQPWHLVLSPLNARSSISRRPHRLLSSMPPGCASPGRCTRQSCPLLTTSPLAATPRVCAALSRRISHLDDERVGRTALMIRRPHPPGSMDGRQRLAGATDRALSKSSPGSRRCRSPLRV